MESMDDFRLGPAPGRNPAGKTAARAEETSKKFLLFTGLKPGLGGSFSQRWRYYFVYQLLVKALIFLCALPLAALQLWALSTTGAVTNATIGAFLFSAKGVVFLVAYLVFALLAVMLELGGYAIMATWQVWGAGRVLYREVLREAGRNFTKLFSLGGLVFLFYLAVIVPLTGVGLRLGLFRAVSIPKFILSAIEESPSYSLLYFACLLILLTAGLGMIFFLPLLVVSRLNATAALGFSYALVFRHPRFFLREVLARLVFIQILAAVVVGIWILLVHAVLALPLTLGPFVRSLLMFGVCLQFLVSFLYLALLPAYVMELACRGLKQLLGEGDFDGGNLGAGNLGTGDSGAGSVAGEADLENMEKIRGGKIGSLAVGGVASRVESDISNRVESRAEKLLGHPVATPVGVIALMCLVAAVSGVWFGQIQGLMRSVVPAATVNIIAHRAGGFAAAENTLAGLDFAIARGVGGVEIDVQRSKDGVYVLNHDESFLRVAGEPRGAWELSSAQIAKLRVRGAGAQSGEPVATLQQFLDRAGDKVQVFIELKGKTADERMVDEVVEMLKERKMIDCAVLISLDYQLVKYVDRVYPEVPVGFLYFLAMGNTEKLVGDYLLMEQGDASDERIEEIWAAGKLPIVWTLNSEESVDAFVDKPLYAVITDEVELVQSYARLGAQERLKAAFSRLLLGRGL